MSWFSSKNKSSFTRILPENLVSEFSKRKRDLLLLSLLSLGTLFASLAIVGTQLFYPFHFIIGFSLYIVSYIPVLRRLYLSRDTWRKYHAYKATRSFFIREAARIALFIFLFVVAAAFLWVRPLDGNPFADLSNDEIASRVEDDLYRAVTAMDYLESTGNELLAVIDDTTLATNRNEKITAAFHALLEAIGYSESLTDIHRYFASIPYAENDARIKSFLIANSLYAKKYELVNRLMLATKDDTLAQKALNEYVPILGRAAVFNEMVWRYYQPKTKVRLYGGHWYQKIFVSTRTRNDAYDLLRDKANNSFTYITSNFTKNLITTPTVLANAAEQKMFDAWFPVQKSVATAMGRAIISTRGKEGLITEAQARTMGEYMYPGDIMLQRRNWHISNVGIPGFWTHSALYTGSLEDMDSYFSSEFPIGTHERMSELIESSFPQVYERYTAATDDQMMVIEAIEPGVVLQTLPVSADADFVVVLRPKLTKRDTLQALLRAFANYGKPYDFNFDFDTRDAMVCSELVYDAYLEQSPDKAGLYFETSLVNGRPIVSPFDIAKKYVAEKDSVDQELSFVYFIRSNEKTGLADVSDEATFVDSLNWSKFSFLQEN
jgi:F0F1-type ATP synthase assembly protein I